MLRPSHHQFDLDDLDELNHIEMGGSTTLLEAAVDVLTVWIEVLVVEIQMHLGWMVAELILPVGVECRFPGDENIQLVLQE